MTRLGYQIPNLTYPDTRPEEIFDKVVAQAKTVALGLDGITVDLPVNGHNVERIALLGEIAQKALG